ncbi:MAG: hypothetical protein NTZ67_04985 [Gammaproteobacteria bacterium]|nr:hypothetical protein [Gammaproteobacteria bacterium]
MKQIRFSFSTLFLCSLFSCAFASSDNLNLAAKNPTEKAAQPQPVSNRSWYFSWGYNKDYWSNSDIHISQPGLNNNFTIHGVTAGDYPGWNTGIFNKDMMSPQYNIRIGHFINTAHTWGIEINFDHAKYNTNPYQVANVTGTINGQPINQNKVLTPQYFSYALHNGANELMLNLVRRKPMISFGRAMFQLVAIGKVGAGVMIPHPESTIMGNNSNVGPKAWGNYFGWDHGWWQMGGWTAGAEVGAQLVFRQAAYLELTDKEAFASLSHIQVYDGTASQNLWLNEVILNLGVMV